MEDEMSRGFQADGKGNFVPYDDDVDSGGGRVGMCERTGDLRFLHTPPGAGRGESYILQQAWIYHDTGEVEWRNVPTFEAPVP
jgi:hypothetical protein